MHRIGLDGPQSLIVQMKKADSATIAINATQALPRAVAGHRPCGETACSWDWDSGERLPVSRGFLPGARGAGPVV